MIVKEHIEKLVGEKTEGTGLYLVDVSVAPGNSIQVLIDSFDGVTIEACAEISRFLNESLDRETEDYSLEVSSPGLGSSFKVRQQYDKNIGRDIEVVFLNGMKKKGRLLGVTDEGFEIETVEKVPVPGDARKKKGVPVSMKIGFNEIKTTKAVISFK